MFYMWWHDVERKGVMHPPNKNIKNNYNNKSNNKCNQNNFYIVNGDVPIVLVTTSKVGSSKWKK